MDRLLQILILEDVASDAELVKFELMEAGLNFNSSCVQSRETFLKALSEYRPDIILSDYSLPSFDGLTALTIVSEQYPDIPFIFVSGALGEERAIDLLKKGATDYVLKNSLSRLAPAVLRALQEAEERAERKRMEQALQESEAKYRVIFENTGTATIITDQDNLIALANGQFERLSGYRRAEVEGIKYLADFVSEDDLALVVACENNNSSDYEQAPKNCEFKFISREGKTRYIFASIMGIPSSNSAVVSLLDITGRKMAEESLRKRELDLEMKSRSLEETNTALKVLLKHREEDKGMIEEQVLTNVKKLVIPYLEDLKHQKLDKSQIARVEIIEKNLNDVVSPFLRNLSSSFLDLTPREIQIANLVKEGKTTKEITELLNISATAVDFHRKNLRSKFGIKNKRTNLRSHLASLSS